MTPSGQFKRDAGSGAVAEPQGRPGRVGRIKCAQGVVEAGDQRRHVVNRGLPQTPLTSGQLNGPDLNAVGSQGASPFTERRRAASGMRKAEPPSDGTGH